MPIEINGVKLYDSQETAEKLDTTPNMLAYWRREKRIESTLIGQNHFFTDEQIANADTKPRTRGRKKVQKDDEGNSASSQWMLMNRTAYKAGVA